MGCNKSRAKRQIYYNTSLSQETREVPNKQYNLKSKATRK